MQKQFFLFIFYLSLCVIPPFAWSEQAYVIEPFVAHYEAKKLGMTLGRMQLALTQLGPHYYKFEAFSQTTGLASVFSKNKIVERSYWQRHKQQIQPLQYWFSQTGRKNRKISVKFDWQQKTAQQNKNGHLASFPLERDAHDRLSYQIALMYELYRGQRQFEYPVMERNGFRFYSFKVLAEEQIHTKLGKLTALKIERVRKNTHNQRATVFWCAKRLAYLPVRIQHTEKNGSTFIMNIIKIQGLLKDHLNANPANSTP